MFKKYLKELSLPESYISVTLGFLVVVVAGLFLYNNFSKNKTPPGQEQKPEAAAVEQKTAESVSLPVTHTVAQGESLWSIAEKYFQSGYNWVTIAKENNLANADQITVGQKLAIPKAETIRPLAENVSSAATSVATEYTVVRGDNLWNIAVKEYNDGFMWTKIAQANNLANPRVIHAGNILKLPR